MTFVRWIALWLTAALAACLLFALEPLLPAPPVSPGDFARWVGSRDPALATMSIIRVGGLAAAWYLLASLSFQTLARLSHAAPLRRLADLVSPPAVRRLAEITFAGGTLAVMLPAPPGVHGETHPRPAAAETVPGELVMTQIDHPVDPRDRGAAPRPLDGGAAADPAPGRVDAPRMRLIAPTTTEAASGPAPVEIHPDALVIERESPAPAAPGAGESGERVVMPGDHFWSIAEEIVASTTGDAGDTRAVTTYWSRLVDANRERLVDPGNIDLLYAGQRIVIPAP